MSLIKLEFNTCNYTNVNEQIIMKNIKDQNKNQ